MGEDIRFEIRTMGKNKKSQKLSNFLETWINDEDFLEYENKITDDGHFCAYIDSGSFNWAGDYKDFAIKMVQADPVVDFTLTGEVTDHDYTQSVDVVYSSGELKFKSTGWYACVDLEDFDEDEINEILAEVDDETAKKLLCQGKYYISGDISSDEEVMLSLPWGDYEIVKVSKPKREKTAESVYTTEEMKSLENAPMLYANSATLNQLIDLAISDCNETEEFNLPDSTALVVHQVDGFQVMALTVTTIRITVSFYQRHKDNDLGKMVSFESCSIDGDTCHIEKMSNNAQAILVSLLYARNALLAKELLRESKGITHYEMIQDKANKNELCVKILDNPPKLYFADVEYVRF